MERLVKELKGITLDKNETYELIQFPLPYGRKPDDVLKVLKMKCPSTQNLYFLRVPPVCNEVIEALNWSYGIDVTQIKSGDGVEIIKET